MSVQDSLAEADEQTLEQLKHDPRLYVRNSWVHPNDQGRKYDFKTTDGQQALHYLLDPHSPLNPSQWGAVNILLVVLGFLSIIVEIMISEIIAWINGVIA